MLLLAIILIGSGAKIKQGVKIGKNCIIGMGVNLKKDLKNNTKITT